MSDDIPVPTVHLLAKELKEVNDWYTFGVALDIPVRQLRIIQSSNPHAGVDRWLVDMFEYWLSSNPDASWKDIIQALEQTDQLVLAAEVKMKYLSPPAPTTTVVEDVDAEVQADASVVGQLIDLEISFSFMFTNVRKVLANCDLSLAQVFLNTLSGTDDFSRCDNFNALLHHLRQNYIDVFNIRCLEELVAYFEKDELKKSIDEYKTKKDKFLSDTKVAGFQKAVVSRAEPSIQSGKAVVKIKIPHPRKWGLRNCSPALKDIEELARKGFGDCYASLVRLHVTIGSIIISWLFPVAMSDKLIKSVEDNAAIFKDAGVEEVIIAGRIVFFDSQESEMEKTTLKRVYTEFYHQLVDAVSNSHTCQSLTAQLHHTTLISQEKITQLSSGQHTGISFLKVLGVEEDPQLLSVLMEKMANVEQLQSLWKSMSTWLSTMKKEAVDVEYESKVAQEQLEARIVQLTNEKEELLAKWQHYEEELKGANELLIMREKALSGMMSHDHKRDDDMKKMISQYEEEVARLRLQRESYTDAAVQTTNEEDEAAMVCVPIPPKSVLMEQPTAATAGSLISRLSDHGRSKRLTSLPSVPTNPKPVATHSTQQLTATVDSEQKIPADNEEDSFFTDTEKETVYKISSPSAFEPLQISLSTVEDRSLQTSSSAVEDRPSQTSPSDRPPHTSPSTVKDGPPQTSPSAVEHRPSQTSPSTVHVDDCSPPSAVEDRPPQTSPSAVAVVQEQASIPIANVMGLMENRPLFITSTQDLPVGVVVARMDSHTGMSPDPTSTTADSEKALLPATSTPPPLKHVKHTYRKPAQEVTYPVQETTTTTTADSEKALLPSPSPPPVKHVQRTRRKPAPHRPAKELTYLVQEATATADSEKALLPPTSPPAYTHPEPVVSHLVLETTTTTADSEKALLFSSSSPTPFVLKKQLLEGHPVQETDTAATEERITMPGSLFVPTQPKPEARFPTQQTTKRSHDEEMDSYLTESGRETTEHTSK